MADSLGECVHEVEHDEAKALAYVAVVVVAWSGENTDSDGAQVVAMANVLVFASSRAKERRGSEWGWSGELLGGRSMLPCMDDASALHRARGAQQSREGGCLFWASCGLIWTLGPKRYFLYSYALQL